MHYKLTIVPDDAGGYVGCSDSEDGDLWVKLKQQPQKGEQFRRALVAFAEAHGLPYDVMEPTAQVPQIEMPADVERAPLNVPRRT